MLGRCGRLDELDQHAPGVARVDEVDPRARGSPARRVVEQTHPLVAQRGARRVDVGDDGHREEIVIWIERRPGAVWAVGRAIDPRNRSVPEPVPDDYVFEGYEMTDALEAANVALQDDLVVSQGEGVDETVSFFNDDELLRPLERWFFGH